MDKLDEAIYAYLDSRHATLWGRAFDVHPESPGRQLAANFIREVIEGVAFQERAARDPLSQGV